MDWGGARGRARELGVMAGSWGTDYLSYLPTYLPPTYLPIYLLPTYLSSSYLLPPTYLLHLTLTASYTYLLPPTSYPPPTYLLPPTYLPHLPHIDGESKPLWLRMKCHRRPVQRSSFVAQAHKAQVSKGQIQRKSNATESHLLLLLLCSYSYSYSFSYSYWMKNKILQPPQSLQALQGHKSPALLKSQKFYYPLTLTLPY